MACIAQRHLKNWLDAYVQYTQETESPTVFHLWCVLTAALES